MEMVLTTAYNQNQPIYMPGIEQSKKRESYRAFSSMSLTNGILFPFFFDEKTKRNRTEPLLTYSMKEDKSTEYLNGIHFCFKGGSVTSSALRRNVKKVELFMTLQKGWDGENGKTFSREFTNTIIGLLRQLDKQPEVFPISDGSIQLEYETARGEYLEFEISEDNRVSVFHIDKDGNETHDVFLFDADSIKRQVASFHG